MWVADRRARARSRCARGRRGGERADVRVEGHHYALVHVTGLPAGRADAVRGARSTASGVWPLAGQPVPAERVCAPTTARRATRIVFGSCRVAAPHEPPHTLRKDEDPRRARGRRAARRSRCACADQPPEEWPHALLLLGDQVYADEVHPERRGARSTATARSCELRRLRTRSTARRGASR